MGVPVVWSLVSLPGDSCGAFPWLTYVLGHLKQIQASSANPLPGITTFFRSNGFLLQSLKAN